MFGIPHSCSCIQLIPTIGSFQCFPIPRPQESPQLWATAKSREKAPSQTQAAHKSQELLWMFVAKQTSETNLLYAPAELKKVIFVPPSSQYITICFYCMFMPKQLILSISQHQLFGQLPYLGLSALLKGTVVAARFLHHYATTSHIGPTI